MKYNQYIVTALSLFLLAACQQEDALPTGEKGVLTIAPTVEAMTQTQVRSVGNSFFELGDKISLTITPSNADKPLPSINYTYDAYGIFTGGKNPYLFPLDNSYIATLKAQWPADGKAGEVETDQREWKDYQKSDYLEAEAELKGIMPTDAPVPLSFKHLNCRLVFELTGQNANGLVIKSLIMELSKTAYWAYCGNADGNAELILNPGIEIKPDATQELGRIKVGGVKEYTGDIFFPNGTNLTLEAGKSYLVTLTPRGDNLIASIQIGGFGQDEEGVGVPFQQPTSADDGAYYEISNTAQLVTLSYLIRNYPSPDGANNAEGTNWRAQTYKITADFSMTSVAWTPIPKSLLDEKKIDIQGHTITFKPGDDLFN